MTVDILTALYHAVRMDFLDLEIKLAEQFNEIYAASKVNFSPSSIHADLSTNALFVIGKMHQLKPQEVFHELSLQLDESIKQNFQSISVAKNGFLNFKVSDDFLEFGLRKILSDKSYYFEKNDTKVNVEFVSANPTGPLHYGNSRSVYGDALANILSFSGYDVTKEYYVNDAGNQINVLANSVFSEYLQIQGSPTLTLEESYQGEYITSIAQAIFNADGNKWNKNNYVEHFKQFSVDYIINLIKGDLKAVGIQHDIWVRETSILDQVPIALQILQDKNLVYKGKLGHILSKKGTESGQELMLFKSSNFGDSEDRALTKPNGEYTYFANDIGYFYDKIRRDFRWLIVVLGADHDGYLKRLHSAVTSLDKSIRLDIKTCQIVLFKKNGENIKLSKRSGNALGLREAVESIGKDMFRFLMLSKSLDTHYTVDTEKLTELSMENPFYYLQYAHARLCSIIKESGFAPNDVNNISIEHNVSIEHLTPSMVNLLKTLLSFRKQVESVVRTLEVHKIINYLHGIAEQVHGIWNEGKQDITKKWIVRDKNNSPTNDNDEQITQQRVMFAFAIKKIIQQGLSLLDISAYDEL